MSSTRAVLMSLLVCACACGESSFGDSRTGTGNDGTGNTPGGGTGGTPSFERDCTSGPLDTPIDDCAPEPLESTGDPSLDCVNRINQLRWECQCLPPLARWSAGESCAAQHAAYDSTRSPHAGFQAGICEEGGWAQNECPGWRSVEQVVTGCLQAMWDEGPGPWGPDHGHYINMTNPDYDRVACGFHATGDGQIWAVQNFQ